MTGSGSSLIQLLCFSLLGMGLTTVSLFVGIFLYNIRLGNPFRSFFLNSFLGLFTIICIYSFTRAGFKTVNDIAFLALVFVAYKNKDRFRYVRTDLKPLVHILYIFPVVFLLYGYYTLPGSIENDVRYYAKIAYSLQAFGQENLYHWYNTYDHELNGMMPYHYSELWLAALFNQFLGIKSVIALKYLAYPYFISNICVGMLGLIQKAGPLEFLLFIALTLLPFHIVSVFSTGYVVYTDFWLRPNFIMYYFGLLALFYLVMEKRWILLWMCAVVISTTSVIIIPCLFGGLFILSLALSYKKDIQLREFIFLNAVLLVTGMLMVALYLGFAPHVNLFGGQSLVNLLHASLAPWKAVVFITAALICECVLLILTAVLFNRFFIRLPSVWYVYLFALSQVIIGVVLFQSLNQLDNSYQFPYFAFAASGFVLIITIVLAVDRSKRIAKPWITFSIVLLAMFYTRQDFHFRILQSLERTNLLESGLSDGMISASREYLKNGKSGGFVLRTHDLNSFTPKARNCLTNQLGSFVAYISDNCNLPSLTCLDTLFEDKTTLNAKDFAKAANWYKVFPNYTKDCDPYSYLARNEFDYFICTRPATVKPGYKIIDDPHCLYAIVTAE
jgi:hypothetical protein